MNARQTLAAQRVAPAVAGHDPGVLERTEESQLRSIEDALLRRFEGRVPPATVRAEVRASKELFSDARIRNFVPVLVQREAAMRLRRLPARAVA